MLEVSDLHVSYGSMKALHGVSFNVKEGSVVTLIGANGAGMTTTLNTIAGLLRQKEGKIVFNGEDISSMPPRQRVQRGLVLCPEGRQIFPRMTVEGNLELGAFIQKDQKAIEKNYELVYDMFPILKDRAKQVAGTLSGGEQQMLAIGRSLMASPKLLMLDEPSLGLAPIFVEQIFKMIVEIKNLGTTILLVEQNALSALKIADAGYVMEVGNITLSGSGEELSNNEMVKTSYLGA